jgi:hypothetical protein
MTRTLARWYDPEPLGVAVAGSSSEDSCIHVEGKKGQLGHSGRLKVETDSNPPAVLSTSMCRTTPVAMGCVLACVIAHLVKARDGSHRSSQRLAPLEMV